MEVFQIVQIVYIFAIFFLTLLFVLLPLKLIPADRVQLSTRRSQRIIDFCNCFAGGVFLGTCFVQLVPYVEAKFQEAFLAGDLPIAYGPTLTQVTVMLGFFLVLLMEQVVKVCQGRSAGTNQTDSQELAPVKGYIVAVSSEEEEEDDDGSGRSDEEESDVELTREKKRMLNPPRKDRLKAAKLTARKKNKNTPHRHLRTSENPDVAQVTEPRSNGEQKLLACQNHADEHVPGHAHIHLADLAQGEFGLRCVVLLFALSLHSLFEGVAIGLQDDLWKLVNLIVGISVHGCLVAFALGISLARQRLARLTVVKLCLVFSATIPVGIAIGMGVGGIHSFVSTLISAILQGLTAGTFVYVIFVEILPGEVDRNRDRLMKVLVMFIGFAITSSLRFVMKEKKH